MYICLCTYLCVHMYVNVCVCVCKYMYIIAIQFFIYQKSGFSAYVGFPLEQRRLLQPRRPASQLQ